MNDPVDLQATQKELARILTSLALELPEPVWQDTAPRIMALVDPLLALMRQKDEALRAILKAARGDEHGECHTIRRWLDEHGLFNGDIQGAKRLIEETCKAAIALTRDEEERR